MRLELREGLHAAQRGYQDLLNHRRQRGDTRPRASNGRRVQVPLAHKHQLHAHTHVAHACRHRGHRRSSGGMAACSSVELHACTGGACEPRSRLRGRVGRAVGQVRHAVDCGRRRTCVTAAQNCARYVHAPRMSWPSFQTADSCKAATSAESVATSDSSERLSGRCRYACARQGTDYVIRRGDDVRRRGAAGAHLLERKQPALHRCGLIEPHAVHRVAVQEPSIRERAPVVDRCGEPKLGDVGGLDLRAVARSARGCMHGCAYRCLHSRAWC
jgi:hypothetical protein